MGSENPVASGNSNGSADWELELARAYQSAQGDRTPANASGPTVTGSSTNSPTADAAEPWKKELAQVTEEKEALKTQLQAASAQLEETEKSKSPLSSRF